MQIRPKSLVNLKTVESDEDKGNNNSKTQKESKLSRSRSRNMNDGPLDIEAFNPKLRSSYESDNLQEEVDLFCPYYKIRSKSNVVDDGLTNKLEI
jgi:hypothetical protein